jgi:hypothetical protein
MNGSARRTRCSGATFCPYAANDISEAAITAAICEMGLILCFCANQLQIYKKIAITRRFYSIFRKREKDFAKELFIFYENSIFAKIVGVYAPKMICKQTIFL